MAESDIRQEIDQSSESAEETNTEQAFYVLGIGASAGGLEALETFFDKMPSDNQFAFIVIQHLSPDYKSLMAELLAKHTPMQIYQAEDGTEIKAGSIYLIPRKSNMTIFNGRLFLSPKEDGLNLPIDIFLSSLAEDQRESAIGIILSGTGSDGTRGIRAIKEAGGMVMVQTEDTAKFDGMPRSAISTGIVDYVLPVDKMPQELLNYARGNIKLIQSKSRHSSTSNSLAKIFILIKRKTGVDLSYYKESTLYRRIERRMGINQIQDIDAYIEFMEKHPPEIHTLYKEILIGVTKFFRDSEAFKVIYEKVLGEIINSKNPKDSFRVWIPGCSTGEEAYSIAMLIAEYMDQHNIDAEVKVFATDIDKDAMEFASFGVYPESIVADVPEYYLKKYFKKKTDNFQILPKIREMVIFAYHNVFKDPPFRRIDLISCRNLLIYLQPVLQKKILSNFYFSLNKDGFLFLGSSETVGDNSKYFSNFDVKWKIFRYMGGYSSTSGRLDASQLKWNPKIQEQISELPNNRGQSKEFEMIYEKLIEQWFPPTAIINESRELLHIFGDTEDYLRLPMGKMDLDILKMAKQSISVPLGTALHTALKENQQVNYDGIQVENGKTSFPIQLIVIPLQGILGNKYLAVLFKAVEQENTGQKSIQSFTVDESIERRINDLESELQHSKENLQATIEELETSNEELQATNEELLSSNEELQSTNEELQSVNEELITVNSEYQKKIEELSDLNDDMNNLLASTDIGTIFLDNDMTIRKYTPPVSQQVNIIKTDLGRPFSDLSHKLDYPNFIEDIREVMATNKPKEAEIQNSDGKWFLVKISPYESQTVRMHGTIISFININQRKEAEYSALRNQELLMRILESSPTATTMLDEKGRIIFLNRGGEELLGITRKELGSITYRDPRFAISDSDGKPIEKEKDPFRKILNNGEQIKNYSICLKNAKDEKKTLRINGNPMYDEKGNVHGAVFNLEEIEEK